MQDYQVGQILFFIADSTKVIPIQIIEEIIRTTLEGQEKSYIAKLPDKKESTIDISKLKGNLFENETDVKKFMLKNANNAIIKMINESVEVAIGLFNYKTEEQKSIDTWKIPDEDSITQKVQPENNNGIIKVDLGNGTFGKMSVNDLNKTGES